MYSSTFIFSRTQSDDTFHKVDRAIAKAAQSIPGYLGEDAWENAITGQYSNIYYWKSLRALKALLLHPKHIEARNAHAKLSDGYQVIISEVIRSYGNAKQSI